MDDYIARQPILNSKAQVCAYHLFYSQSTANLTPYGEAQSESGVITPAFSELFSDMSDHAPSFINYFDGLTETVWDRQEPGVIVFGRNDDAAPEAFKALRAKGYRLALDSAYFSICSPAAAAADVMLVDFSSVSLAAQTALIRKHKGHVALLATKIENWSDFKAAKDLGYELFGGFFFLWPTGSPVRTEIKSLDISLLSILSELEKPEPNYKSITNAIEHDLGMSYKLLRLVNSAYMAPRYKIKSIAQALTYLGTRELHQWISMLMLGGIKSGENSELVVMSLIRGKLMALVAQELQLPYAGAEPFFTGLFSLIDVILNSDMNAVLTGLPLPDDIKSALLGTGNALSELLSFVVSYEQAEWWKLDGRHPMAALTPRRMVSLYIEAYKWARLVDRPI